MKMIYMMMIPPAIWGTYKLIQGVREEIKREKRRRDEALINWLRLKKQEREMNETLIKEPPIKKYENNVVQFKKRKNLKKRKK